jgi:hypothetical protein
MIAFIIKSSLSLIVLFGLYWFLLRKEKLFVFNRFFLLFSIIFSLTIPFIVIPVTVQNKQLNNNLVTVLNSSIPLLNRNQNAVSINSNQPYNEIEASALSQVSTYDSTLMSSWGERFISGINSFDILLILYISVVILLLFRFFKNIFIIRQKLLQSEKADNSGYRIALLDYQVNPFCFFNTIFVNKHDYLNNKLAKELLAHEFEHIKQSHSIDVLFVELVQIFFWFNPILLLYNRAVRENHEYLADNGVILFSSDIRSYAENLLNFISCNRNIPLTSGFNQSLTRKRLLMLTKANASIYLDRLRILITICLVVVSFLFLSCRLSNKQNLIIDLESNIGNFKELTLSQINAEINYLPLSKSNVSGMNRVISMDVSEDYILINDYKQCLLYDKNGKLLAKIYEKDRSENEKGILLKSRFGPHNVIYVNNIFNLMEFDYNGKYLKTIDFNKEKIEDFYFESWAPINDSLIFVQIPNSSGQEISKAIIYNLNGDPVYKYRNHITLNRSRKCLSTMDAEADFNVYNKHVYIKELMNDTLFYLNSDFKLVPDVVFNLGRYSFPDSLRENFFSQNRNPSGYVYVNNTFQSKDFMFLDCQFSHNIPPPERIPGKKQWWEESKPWYNTTQVLGIYNRSDNTLSFSKLTSTANTLFTTGLYNDIDAGPRFYPSKQVNDSTFVMWMNAASFKDHIASDDFKNNNSKFPDKKKSLEELAGKLTDPDEIILMYVTVK